MSLAIIARVMVQPHPNADRLQIGTVLGYQVVVGMNVENDDLGIYFPEGLQLSEEFAEANNLIRRKCPETGQNVGGFFEEHRRVRCQKFRGVQSEGFWIPVSALAYIEGADTVDLSEGVRLEECLGRPICNKYITPATQRARGTNRSNSRRETTMFKAHFDTDQLRMNLHAIREGDLVVVTLKMHGTSQRVGRVLDYVEPKLTWFQRLLNRWSITIFGNPFYWPKQEWTYLTGSRNVILRSRSDSGYHDPDFREKASQRFYGKLHKGETVYFEVAGYEKLGVPIMGRHLAEGEVKKQYGREITYHYGCPSGGHVVAVYRITHTNEDGVVIELPWSQVKARCQDLGVPHVPEMKRPFHYCGDHDKFMEFVNEIVDGPDPIGTTHPREGVCVRIENGSRTRIFKHKSFTFGVLEGYIKDDANYVDAEEIS